MAITQSAPAASAWRARSTAWSVPGVLTWTMTGTPPAVTSTAVLARLAIRHRFRFLASSCLERHDLLLLRAEPVDAEFDHVAGLQILWLYLAAEADARRRAGDDHVAGLQHEELRAIPDDMLAIEDHVAGVAVLALFAVDVRPYREVLRVLDFVLGDEPGTERAEGLGALALADGLPVLQLESALRYVIADAIAGDDVQGFFLR